MVLPSQLAVRTRMVFDPAERGLASVPMLGRYNYTHANPPLKTHSHPHAMEICLLVRGRQVYSAGGERFHLHGGDVFFTYPDESHDTAGTPEEKGLLYWLSVLDPARTGGALLGLSARESRILWKTLTRPARRHFPATPGMRGHLDAVIRSLHEPEDPLGTVFRANHLVGFLLAFIAARAGGPKKPSGSRFGKVLAHIEAHLADPGALNVGSLADLAELSVSRFKVCFKAELGVPPAEYVLRARIKEAQRRLARPDATVTDVALGLGFSSSQYFASSFKRLTNTTPSLSRRRSGRGRSPSR